MTPSNITRIRRGRNYLKFLFLFILLIGYPHLALAQRNLTSLIQKVSPSVAIIYMLNDNTEFIGLGSGFFVKKEGVLLTNYHVIENILPIKGLVQKIWRVIWLYYRLKLKVNTVLL